MAITIGSKSCTRDKWRARLSGPKLCWVFWRETISE